jgi:hypothetical protein
MAIGMLWVFTCCTSANTPRQQKPDEAPAEGKGSPEAASETPLEVAPDVSPEEPLFYVHTVRWPGESLSHIAQWYTGAAKDWRAIAEANPGLNPNRILIGDSVLIPEDLLRTREPMPRDFLPPAVGKSDAQSSPVEHPPEKSGEGEPPGPIEEEQPRGESDGMEFIGPVE